MTETEPYVKANARAEASGEQASANGACANLAPLPPIQTSSQFVHGFIPPDYLIDRIVQRGFLYSNTAITGSGKTAILLLICSHVAIGRPIGDIPVQQGRVIFFAGENPDDIRARWIAMAEHMDFDVNTIPVSFIAGVFNIPDMVTKIQEDCQRNGDLALVCVDTGAAYYIGEDDNSNVQMGNYARKLRSSLTTLPGKPTVVVNMHPVKNASANSDNLVPRGGGAFLNEVDGNLCVKGEFPAIKLHYAGKLRGPGFDEIPFELKSVTANALVDRNGRYIPTVIARPMSEQAQEQIEGAVQRVQDKLLVAMIENEGATVRKLATAAGLMSGKGEPQVSTTNRILKVLQKDKLTTQVRTKWQLTERGKKEAQNALENSEHKK